MCEQKSLAFDSEYRLEAEEVEEGDGGYGGVDGGAGHAEAAQAPQRRRLGIGRGARLCEVVHVERDGIGESFLADERVPSEAVGLESALLELSARRCTQQPLLVVLHTRDTIGFTCGTARAARCSVAVGCGDGRAEQDLGELDGRLIALAVQPEHPLHRLQGTRLHLGIEGDYRHRGHGPWAAEQIPRK